MLIKHNTPSIKEYSTSLLEHKCRKRLFVFNVQMRIKEWYPFRWVMFQTLPLWVLVSLRLWDFTFYNHDCGIVSLLPRYKGYFALVHLDVSERILEQVLSNSVWTQNINNWWKSNLKCLLFQSVSIFKYVNRNTEQILINFSYHNIKTH